MIVGFEDLSQFRGKVAMVDGAFDPLHQGHVEYFAAAAKLGLPLLCNVASDRYVGTKRPPLLGETQRAAIVDAMRDIAYTHINRYDTETVLRELRPKYYVKGKDWEGRLPPEQVAICCEHGIGIVYLDTVLDSSTRILQAYATNGFTTMAVAEFERLVLEQRPVDAVQYDAAYFTGDWRAGGNNYSLETRRQIEGRNPHLIKEVFQPRRVLDLGCGPGALMHLLCEIGVDCDGIDFAKSSKALATPEVRDRITIGSVMDPIKPDNAYDLVICREVMEHLTVLQVRRAVANIARMTSKHVYVTTRFHPSPAHLLDVTTQFDVDPSHITLLNKDFLRALFVLEGCRSRPDLEARMDWLNKGRVLVFEKAAGPQ